MNPILARLASDESTIAVTWRAGVPQEFLLALLLASVVVLPILGGLSYLGYYVFSLPLRRR